MPIGVSPKAIALLDKHSDEQSLQRESEYVAAICTEAGMVVRTDLQKLKRPSLAENHSNVSQIAGVALTNGQKNLLFVTRDWVVLELRNIWWEDSTPS